MMPVVYIALGVGALWFLTSKKAAPASRQNPNNRDTGMIPQGTPTTPPTQTGWPAGALDSLRATPRSTVNKYNYQYGFQTVPVYVTEHTLSLKSGTPLLNANNDIYSGMSNAEGESQMTLINQTEVASLISGQKASATMWIVSSDVPEALYAYYNFVKQYDPNMIAVS